MSFFFMRKLRRKEHMKQKLKRFMAGFMAMLTLVGTLFTNGTTAFAASPQANIAFWNASVKNSGEVSELKPGYNHGKILYSILDGNSAYCMNFGLRADGGQLMNSYDDASTSMSAQQRKLLSYCLYYGFIKEFFFQEILESFVLGVQSVLLSQRRNVLILKN